MTILIADSGSTKTEWRLVNNEKIVASVRTIGFNPYYTDTTAIVAGLREQLLPHLYGSMPDSTYPNGVNSDGVGPDRIYFYGSGCTGPTVNKSIIDALQVVFPGVLSVEVESDLVGAARAVSGPDSGVVCILGTGSNAAVYDGTIITSPGRSLGFWLGDEGSGAYLGRQVVVRFLHGQLPPDLNDAFQKRFPIDRLTVLENAYHQPFPNRYFSQFTPFLSAYIAHPFVSELVYEAFVVFLWLYVLPHPEAKSTPVHFVGSVAGYFDSQLREAVQACNLQTGRIIAAPIDELVRFHRTC